MPNPVFVLFIVCNINGLFKSKILSQSLKCIKYTIETYNVDSFKVEWAWSRNIHFTGVLCTL